MSAELPAAETSRPPTPTPEVLGAVREQLALASEFPGDEGAREDYLELLRTQPACLLRHGGPVHLTASAVVVDRDGGHLALVWHRKGEFWVQPGGHLEASDRDLEQAARREVREELGLDDLERLGPGPALLHRHDLPGAFGACRAHWDVRYLLRTPLPAGETPLRPSSESPEVRWVPWPRAADGSGRTPEHLPPGTVQDFAACLEVLAHHPSLPA